MSITINTKADTANTLIWEARRFRELFEISNRTVTGAYNETSDTSAINYTGSDGEQGELNQIFATLQTASNDWIATDWNLFQSETNTSFIALETSAYSNVSATGLRTKVLSGNVNGALTQIVSGESASNINGDEGGLYKDDDSDGIANALTSTTTTSEALSNSIQSFTATAQNGRLTFDSRTVTASDVILIVMEDCTADSSSVILNVNSGATTVTDAHSGSGTEQLALLITANAITVTIDYRDTRAGAWTEVSFGKTRIINLTEEGDAALSLADALLKYAKHFDNIGHTTINQKITGTNGEFELKEPYVLPKTPDGTVSEIVTLDGQNFARIKHKQFLLDGKLAWTSFATNTNTYFAQLTGFGEGILFGGTDAGEALNNDGKFPIINDTSDARHIRIFGAANSLGLWIEKTLVDAMPSGGTLAGFKEYFNQEKAEYSASIIGSAYIDIPIKHLASIENGTWENNSTILPSAITLTYPTNEAGERESSQIAQNQIVTTESVFVDEQTDIVFTDTIDLVGEYSQNTKIIFSDTIDIIDNTETTTISFENGRIVIDGEVI